MFSLVTAEQIYIIYTIHIVIYIISDSGRNSMSELTVYLVLFLLCRNQYIFI